MGLDAARTSGSTILSRRLQPASTIQRPEATTACHRSRRYRSLLGPHSSESPQSIASERLRCCSGRATSLRNRLARCTSYYLDNRLHKLSPIIPSARQAAIKPKTSVVNIGSPSATFLPPLTVELTPLNWGIDRGVCGCGFDSYVATSLQNGEIAPCPNAQR